MFFTIKMINKCIFILIFLLTSFTIMRMSSNFFSFFFSMFPTFYLTIFPLSLKINIYFLFNLANIL